MFAGTPLNIGAVVSRTVTVKLAFAVLPLGSLAEQVTVVVPSGNVDLDKGAHVTGTAWFALSLAVGVAYGTTAPFGPVASAVMFAGIPLMTGGDVLAVHCA